MELVSATKVPAWAGIPVAYWTAWAHVRLIRRQFASQNESQIMTRESTFLVQAFNSKGGRLKPTPPVACKSADGARRTAERLSLSHEGVIAFTVTSDPGTGDYDDSPRYFIVPVNCP